MDIINITAEQLDELETFFKGITIPETIKLHGAITYNDLPGFVKGNLALLKSGELKGLTATMRFNDLNDLKEAFEKNIKI